MRAGGHPTDPLEALWRRPAVMPDRTPQLGAYLLGGLMLAGGLGPPARWVIERARRENEILFQGDVIDVWELHERRDEIDAWEALLDEEAER